MVYQKVCVISTRSRQPAPYLSSKITLYKTPKKSTISDKYKHRTLTKALISLLLCAKFGKECQNSSLYKFDLVSGLSL